MSQVSYTVENYRNKSANQHISIINVMQPKQKHTSSHMTVYDIERLNEAEIYDVELIKNGMNEILGEIN